MKTKFQILFLISIILTLYYISISNPVNTIDDYKMFNWLLNLNSINLYHTFFPHYGGYYRPVCILTYKIDRFVWFLNESFYHLENIIIHTINSILVFFVALELFKDKYKYLPLFAALLFGVHPINTEAVNWISARCDLLAAMFSLLGFLIFLRLKDGKYWIVGVLLSSFIAFFGALSKEVGVAFYPAIAMWVLFFEKGNFRNRIVQALVFIAFGLFYFYFRHIALIHSDVSASRIVSSAEHNNYFKDILIIIQAFGFYVKKLFDPFPLNFGIIHIGKAYLYIGFLVAFVSGMFLFSKDKALGLFVIALWFIAPGTLVALGHVAWTPYAERYVYVASAFFSIFTMYLMFNMFYKKINNKKTFYIVLSILIALCFIASFKRNLVWSSNLTLYKDTIEKSPDFVVARNEYANALYKAGKKKKAEKQYKIAASFKNRLAALPELNFISIDNMSLEEKKKKLENLFNKIPRLNKTILLNIVKINFKLVDKNPDNKTKFYKENAEIFDKIYKHTHNGFYLYKEAQMYIATKNYKKAKECLKEAKRHLSKDNLYYKMADRLLRKIGN